MITVACGVLALAVAIPHARALPPAPSAVPSAAASTPTAAPSASASASAAASATPRRLPGAGEATNTCVTCHATLSDTKLSTPAQQYRQSVHRDDRVGCVGCHKGDPRDPTVGAHSRDQGFQPHPTHAEIPEICGNCHSDPGFMRHLNARLPVGQAALFALSLHGKLTAIGDQSSPTCADCHGRHDVLSPSSPKSPVNRANVAQLCSKCHSDPARMGKYNIATDQFAKWERGVHGVAFRKGNPNAPTCTGCHGAHSATPPEASSVGRACGRCHEEELKYFEQSPHSKSFRSRGLAECAACHGNHDIAVPTAVLVGTTPDATCTTCHTKDEKPRLVAQQTSDLLRGARERAAEARATIERANASGVHIAGTKYALDKLATAELKLRGVVHTLDPARLEAPIAVVDAAVNDAKTLVKNAEDMRKNERRGYYVALALAGILLLSLGLKSFELDRRRRRAS